LKRERSLLSGTEPPSIGCSDRSPDSIPAPFLYTSLTLTTKISHLSYQSLIYVFLVILEKKPLFLKSIDCEVEVFHSPDAENAGLLEELNPHPQLTGFCKRDPMEFYVRLDQN
jgi:hypothetical protein